MNTETRVVKLTVITDFTCPNCYVGERELLNAIIASKSTLGLPLRFELEHLPFKLMNCGLIDEDKPKIDKTDFLFRYLGEEKFEKLKASLKTWSAEKGIPISFKGVMSQTTRAHRMSQKAHKMGGQKMQLPFILAIFKAFMEDGKDIADYDVLAEITEEAGVMSKDQALAFLKSDELQNEVTTTFAQLREKGITGVPMTIIDGKWAVQGGQSSDVYVQIFKKLAACHASGGTCTNSPMPTHLVESLVV